MVEHFGNGLLSQILNVYVEVVRWTPQERVPQIEQHVDVPMLENTDECDEVPWLSPRHRGHNAEVAMFRKSATAALQSDVKWRHGCQL